MKIPSLKIADVDYREAFILNSPLEKDDFLEAITKQYPNVILDVFEAVLDTKDERIELLSNEYFRLYQEDKYLSFAEEVFALNDNKCYINWTFNATDSFEEYILRKISDFDAIDKRIFLHQVMQFCTSRCENFMIDDIVLLKMFLKGILRETLSIDIYFAKKPLLLCSNYDLSLPMVFKNSDDIKMYEKIANKYNLYFR